MQILEPRLPYAHQRQNPGEGGRSPTLFPVHVCLQHLVGGSATNTAPSRSRFRFLRSGSFRHLSTVPGDEHRHLYATPNTGQPPRPSGRPPRSGSSVTSPRSDGPARSTAKRILFGRRSLSCPHAPGPFSSLSSPVPAQRPNRGRDGRGAALGTRPSPRLPRQLDGELP